MEEQSLNYSWRPNTEIVLGGYPGETVGVIPSDPIWVDSTADMGSGTFQCFYRDSTQVAKDCVSTRVLVTGQDAWTVEVEPDNTLVFRVSTTISSIVRDDKRETCGTIPPRDGLLWDYLIRLRRYENGPVLWASGPVYIGAQETIASDITLGSYTFRLPPGGGATFSSLFLTNDYAAKPDDPDEKYHDHFRIGIEFRNNLPAIYRPGKIWDGGEWLSHNRSAGTRKIWDGKRWEVLETFNGPAGSGNAPTIWNGTRHQNMRRIGKE